ncbi:MAG: hypothetical protein HY870_15345, partial [Chloroflexi bacterium]|nr:hypothetical protein [Chloroflexota bacterium]
MSNLLQGKELRPLSGLMLLLTVVSVILLIPQSVLAGTSAQVNNGE